MGSWFFPRLGATALFICTIGSWANPALSQQTLHVETTVTDIASRGFTFGPVSATCDPANGGPGCSFLNFEFTGNCITTEETRAVVPRRCTISGTPSILLSFSSAGMHDSSGNPTGVCAPFFESLVTTYSDGSTISANGQGQVCCADASCSGGFGPPFVTRESTIITGGTGAFAGSRGSGLETSAGYKDGSEIAQQEQVWVLPPSSQR